MISDIYIIKDISKNLIVSSEPWYFKKHYLLVYPDGKHEVFKFDLDTNEIFIMQILYDAWINHINSKLTVQTAFLNNKAVCQHCGAPLKAHLEACDYCGCDYI